VVSFCFLGVIGADFETNFWGWREGDKSDAADVVVDKDEWKIGKELAFLGMSRIQIT
jgi:hypothetical protein